MASIKRINREYNEIQKYIDTEPSDNHRFINISYVNDDIKKIDVSFLGPKISPYEEILSTIRINIPDNYPIKAPHMIFMNKMYHPNISLSDGTICLDILKDQWKPVYTLSTVLMSIISLLSDPNPDSPLNGDAARLYKDSLNNKDSLNTKLTRRKYLQNVLNTQNQTYRIY